MAQLLAFLALAAYGATAVNPLQKTTSLLQDLIAKVQEEDAAAKQEYEKFTAYCDKTARNFQFEIKTEKAQIAELEASIDKETSEGMALDAKVEELSGEIAAAEKQLKDATAIRKKEAADFAAVQQELTETISMIERAISVVKREMSKGESSELQLDRSHDLTQAFAALVQASALSTADSVKLSSFLQDASSDSDAELGAPAAAVYKSQSGTIVDTLEDLLEKAKMQLADATSAETQARHNFKMLEQSLTDETKYSTADMDKAKKGVQLCAESKASATGDLERVSKELSEDEAALSDLKMDCVSKAKDFEEETANRKDEVDALTKALAVLQEKAGGAASQTYDFNQEAASFVQLRSRAKAAESSDESSETSVSSIKVVRFVRHLAMHNASHELVLLSDRLDSMVQAASTAGADPFGKVRGLITDLIAKLEKEAGAEAKQKAYCDKEMADAKETKEDKENEIEKLTTRIDSKTSKSAKLKSEVATLQEELATLVAEMAEADKIRMEEHEQFSKDKPELEEGIEGVKMALKILREYYGSADDSESKGASTGIIGMLEVIESDFTKGLAELVAAEEAAAQAYDKEKKENEIIKATKEADVKYKTKQAVELEKAVAEITSDREAVQAELDAVTEALSKLEAMCIAKAEPYEERQARRAKEISGLKEALEILEGETAFIQLSSRRQLRGVQRHVARDPEYDHDGFKEDWHSEWRQGDYPTHEEIMKNKKDSPEPAMSPTGVDPKVPTKDGEPAYAMGGFKDDWNKEWRSGDFPSYKETYENGKAAAQYEDRQSDGKPSPVASGRF